VVFRAAADQPAAQRARLDASEGGGIRAVEPGAERHPRRWAQVLVGGVGQRGQGGRVLGSEVDPHHGRAPVRRIGTA